MKQWTDEKPAGRPEKRDDIGKSKQDLASAALKAKFNRNDALNLTLRHHPSVIAGSGTYEITARKNHPAHPTEHLPITRLLEQHGFTPGEFVEGQQYTVKPGDSPSYVKFTAAETALDTALELTERQPARA